MGYGAKLGTNLEPGSPGYSTGDLVAIPPITVYYVTRIDSDSSKSGGSSSSNPAQESAPADGSSSLRQPGSGFHTGENGQLESGPHGRITEAKQTANEAEDNIEGELATHGGEQICRPAIPNVEPARVTCCNIALQLRRSVFASSTMSTGVTAVGGSRSETSRHDHTIQRLLGGQLRAPVESTTGMDQPDPTEDSGGPSVRGHSSARLDRAALVRCLAEHDRQISTRVTQTGSVQREAQPSMGAAHRRSGLSFNAYIHWMYALTDSPQDWQSSIAAQLSDTPSGAATLRLAGNVYAASSDSTKTSQWKKFHDFCLLDGHVPLPAPLGACLSYIGFLFEVNRVHAHSLRGYLSAVRTRHTRAGFTDPFGVVAARDLIRAFERGDDARGTHTDVRLGLSSAIMYHIHCLGLEAEPGSQVEFECALIEMQYLLSWREHSIRDMCVSDVSFLTDSPMSSPRSITIQVRPRSLKGQPVRGAVPSALTCVSMVLGASTGNGLSLQLKYSDTLAGRDESSPYWLSPTATWPSAQFVTRALAHVLGLLGISAPSGCYYASHSLRSGSVTMMMLLGIPMPVILQRGRWTSERMVNNVYFDARLVSSDHGWFYFSILVPSVPRLPLSSDR